MPRDKDAEELEQMRHPPFSGRLADGSLAHFRWNSTQREYVETDRTQDNALGGDET